MYGEIIVSIIDSSVDQCFSVWTYTSEMKSGVQGIMEQISD